MKHVNFLFRWLFLALLFTGVVAKNFSEERAVYRIEQTISDSTNQEFATHFKGLSYFNKSKSQPEKEYFAGNNSYKYLSFLSLKIHFQTKLAVTHAPDTQAIIMRSTGQFLNSKSLASEEHSISHS